MPPSVPVDGLLIIDKPAGWTSHDVVARLRRLTSVRRIGHAGTLDPLATGVLPLGIGLGTRVLEYLSGADKRYRATVRLGVETDTYDADGTVVADTDPSGVDAAAVTAALATFVGAIEQRPPAYSAIKQGGVPLHRLARAGRPVEAPPRAVTVFAIDEIAVEPPLVSFAVHCSKGTYVRSIAHDLGRCLGCGAHLVALRRTATGAFALDRAVTLEGWERALEDGSWPAHLLPLDVPLLGHPALILSAAATARLADGVPPSAHVPGLAPGALARAYDDGGVLLAILRATEPETGIWRAEKVLIARSGVR